MTRTWLFLAIPVLLVSAFQPSSESLGQSGLQRLGTVDGWDIRGADGHCQAGYQMKSGLTQFAVGMVPEGSFMTLQNIGWKLRANPRNMMRVTVEFDGERAFRTEALVITMIRCDTDFRRSNRYVGCRFLDPHRICQVDAGERPVWQQFICQCRP